MTAATPATLVLRSGEATVSLVPAVGGGVSAFSWRGHDIFRPADGRTIERGDPLGLSSFPLVPFAGRIPRGRFSIGGRDVALPANLAGESAAIHGQGWQRAWRVEAQSATAATLTFDHAASEWPWRYRARQSFTLDDDALVQELGVTNLSDTPMPAGLGLHPYFPRDADTWLRADVSGVHARADGPASPLPGAWNWRAGVRVEAFVDHQFAGWTGPARIEWPSRGLAVKIACAPPTPYLVVYAPDGRDYFCVEPVSHRLDAVNRSPGGAAHGMVVLEPGQSIRMRARFTIEALSR